MFSSMLSSCSGDPGRWRNTAAVLCGTYPAAGLALVWLDLPQHLRCVKEM